MSRSRELGLFLRARRSQMGSNGGLRQEDAARRAGLSVRHYAAIERGEILEPATQLLDAIARGLSMDEAARLTLYLLAAGHEPPGRGNSADALLQAALPTLNRYLTLLEPAPAYATDPAWYVHAWNRALGDWYIGLPERPPPDRNVVLWLFGDEGAAIQPDIHRERAAILARLRVAFARQPDDPKFRGLVRRLLDESEEARDLWAQQNSSTGRPPPRTWQVRHPRHGLVRVGGLMLELPTGSGRIVVNGHVAVPVGGQVEVSAPRV